MIIPETIRAKLESYPDLIPLFLLLLGLTTDLRQHLIEGEDLTTFLFGTEGVFAAHHVLIPIGSLALLVAVARKAYQSRKEQISSGAMMS